MDKKSVCSTPTETGHYLERWLGNRKHKTTQLYTAHFTKWTKYTQMTPEQLIQQKFQDSQKPPYEQGVVEEKLRGFNKWLRENGTAPRTALVACAVVASFYRHFHMPLSIKLTREFAGAPKGVNETEKMSAEQIQALAYHAQSKRDQAIIWTMFQAGMDVSTLCSLNWGHIEKEIHSPPMGAIMMKGLVREKEPSKTFISFIHKTAARHVKDYLQERWGNDYPSKLEYNTPLFTGRGKWKHHRVTTGEVQTMLRAIAPYSGISRSRLEAADINPLRPHALRASFSDQMAKAGASKQLVDYLMGHKLSYDSAYFGGESGLREAYVRFAELALEPKPLEAPQKIREELENRIQAQQEQINRLADELKFYKQGIKEAKDIFDYMEEKGIIPPSYTLTKKSRKPR